MPLMHLIPLVVEEIMMTLIVGLTTFVLGTIMGFVVAAILHMGRDTEIQYEDGDPK